MNSQNLPEYTMAFGLGPMEIGVVLVIVLVLFGPKRLPGLGKSMGEAIRGFKKGITEDENEIDVTDSVKHEKIKEADADKD
ncbi:MAG: twin-arginine translocase TatA/TatE family subunit [Bdellovibrionales bacterium]